MSHEKKLWTDEELLEQVKKNPNRCPACGSVNLRRVIRDWTFSVAGTWHCLECDCAWDPGMGRVTGALVALGGAGVIAIFGCGVVWIIGDTSKGAYSGSLRWYNFWLPQEWRWAMDVTICAIGIVAGVIGTRKGLRALRSRCRDARILQPGNDDSREG